MAVPRPSADLFPKPIKTGPPKGTIVSNPTSPYHPIGAMEEALQKIKSSAHQQAPFAPPKIKLPNPPAEKISKEPIEKLHLKQTVTAPRIGKVSRPFFQKPKLGA